MTHLASLNLKSTDLKIVIFMANIRHEMTFTSIILVSIRKMQSNIGKRKDLNKDKKMSNKTDSRNLHLMAAKGMRNKAIIPPTHMETLKRRKNGEVGILRRRRHIIRSIWMVISLEKDPIENGSHIVLQILMIQSTLIPNPCLINLNLVEKLHL